jgi:hypothetical protein
VSRVSSRDLHRFMAKAYGRQVDTTSQLWKESTLHDERPDDEAAFVRMVAGVGLDDPRDYWWRTVEHPRRERAAVEAFFAKLKTHEEKVQWALCWHAIPTPSKEMPEDYRWPGEEP